MRVDGSPPAAHDDRGYAMAALLVGMAVMSIMMSMALPVWRTAVQREREAELIFRGEQYAHAVELFSRRNGGFPPSLDVLEKGKFIRKLYKDPVNGESAFQPVYVGQVIAGQPVAPGQPGGGAAGGARGGVLGGAPGAARGGTPARGAAQVPAPGRGARGGQIAGSAPGQAGTIGAGPIIGVVSRSTAESLRLYNGRGRYNEWAFVATAMTQQAGAPTGAQTPNGPGGGVRGGAPPGARPGGPGRGRGVSFPGRGLPFPGRGGPGARGNPFGTQFPQP